jgi:peptidoglycan/LPS O-acetylase OafA/YrhL
MRLGTQQLKIVTSAALAASFLAIFEIGQFDNSSEWLRYASIVAFCVLPIQYAAWREAFANSETKFAYTCAAIGNMGLIAILALIARHYSFEHFLAFCVVGAATLLLTLRFGNFDD